MNDYIAFSAYFGAALTLLVYLLAHRIGAKLHHPLANPMLICLVIMLILLLVLDIDYDNIKSKLPDPETDPISEAQTALNEVIPEGDDV